jgi:hypothetical protein
MHLSKREEEKRQCQMIVHDVASLIAVDIVVIAVTRPNEYRCNVCGQQNTTQREIAICIILNDHQRSCIHINKRINKLQQQQHYRHDVFGVFMSLPLPP